MFRPLHCLLLAMALAAACVTKPAAAQDLTSTRETSMPMRDMGQPTKKRPNSMMLRGGAFMLAVPYLSSVAVAATSDRSADRNLYVPIVGPWMDLAERSCKPNSTNGCKSDGVNKGLLVADGVFQGLGALSIVGAFLFPEIVSTKELKAGGRPRLGAVSLRVEPTWTGGGYGLAAVGKFY